MSKPLIVNMVSESAFSVKGHGVHTAFMEMVAGLRRHSQVEVRINSFRRADITHIHASLGPYALLQLIFGRGKKIVTAHVVPDSLVGSIVGAKLLYPLLSSYLAFIYDRADAVIAVSDDVKMILEKDLEVNTPIYVQYNTIDTGRYKAKDNSRQQARERLGLNQSSFMVLAVGQVQPRKRYDMFIKLAAALPQYQFVWVGGMPFKHLGTDYVKMKRLMESAPSNVRNTGIVELEDVVDYYHAADILLHPADQETFGLIIVEAAAAGLPVLAQDLKVYDSIFGSNILKSSPEGMQRAIQRLAEDEELYARMKKKSMTLAGEYDSRTGTKRLIELYQALAETS